MRLKLCQVTKDLKGNTLYWVDSTGTGHYVGDGSGSTPLPAAIKTIGVGPYVGTPPINFLTLQDTQGDIVGWVAGNGVGGGTLTEGL